MESIGKSPVTPAMLIFGKLAMISCWLFFILENTGVRMIYDSAVTKGLGVIFFLTGLLSVILGLAYLGRSARVGLPSEKQELKTTGIFNITRNPIYLGAFLMCAGSCLFSIHPVNFILFFIVVVIHHSIVLREENYLEETFGDEWLEYKNRVPRYL